MGHRHDHYRGYGDFFPVTALGRLTAFCDARRRRNHRCAGDDPGQLPGHLAGEAEADAQAVGGDDPR